MKTPTPSPIMAGARLMAALSIFLLPILLMQLHCANAVHTTSEAINTAQIAQMLAEQKKQAGGGAAVQEPEERGVHGAKNTKRIHIHELLTKHERYLEG